MFTKTRQLIQITQNKEKFFIDTPGWLYHYEPFGIDVFIHHKVRPEKSGRGFYLDKTWRVSDISTGLSFFGFLYAAHSRKKAVEYLHERLEEISLRRYNEAVLTKLAESPPHKPSWKFVTTRGVARNVAIEVKNEMV